jgi:hypothetical protein
MRTEYRNRLVIGVVGSVLAVLATACAERTPGSPSPHSLQYEYSPPGGTSAVPGTTMSIRIKVLDMPEDVDGLTMTMAAQFQRPDGVVDNSYLPGVPPTTYSKSWNKAFPVSLELLPFVVPLAAPEGNRSIPAGSRILELWATVYMHKDLNMSAGARAVYPVVE